MSNKECYWDNQHANIYTRYIFDVKAYLKGKSVNKQVAVLMLGGFVGTEGQQVCPDRSFDTYSDYLVFLKGDNQKIDDRTFRLKNPDILQSELYASVQGALSYQNGYYSDLLSERPMTEDRLLTRLKEEFGLNAVNVDGQVYQSRFVPTTQTTTATVISINQSQLSTTSVASTIFVAGTVPSANELVIGGSGFGTTAAQVYFPNVDDPLNTNSFVVASAPTDIQSWTNTQIITKIPVRAGSGRGYVVINGSAMVAFDIVIKWSEFNIDNNNFNFPSTVRQEPRLINKNGNGGYVFNYSTANANFSTNTNAKAAFERAVCTWTSNTRVKFQVSTANTANSYAASTPQYYAFTDASPYQGINYYRLNQVDNDGISTLSKVVTVEMREVNKRFSVQPNPFHDNCMINTNFEGNYTVELFDVTGRLLQSHSIHQSSFQLQTADLPNGLYMISAKSNDVQQTFKIVKQ